MKIFDGLVGLLASKKGVLSLLTLTATVVISLKGHMDPAVAACLAVVQGIFCWTAHKTDIAALGIKNDQ